MKVEKYILQIEKPCSENWNNMTTTNNGKFCNSCVKNVVDFSNMSDSQIINFIKQSSGNICGRLNDNQMNRELIKLPEFPNRTLIYKFLASIFLFGFTHKLFSKNQDNSVSFNPKIKNTNIEIHSENISINDTNKRRISGRIINQQSNEPLKYITIQLIGTELKTYTDSNGYFSMNIPKSLLKDTMDFCTNHVYFKIEYFQKTKADLNIFQEIKLTRKEYVVITKARPMIVSTMGAVITIERPNLLKRTQYKIKNLFRKKTDSN